MGLGLVCFSFDDMVASCVPVRISIRVFLSNLKFILIYRDKTKLKHGLLFFRCSFLSIQCIQNSPIH